MQRRLRRRTLIAIAVVAAILAMFVGYSTFAKTGVHSIAHESVELSEKLGAHPSSVSSLGARATPVVPLPRRETSPGDRGALLLPGAILPLESVSSNAFWSLRISDTPSSALPTFPVLFGSGGSGSLGSGPTGTAVASFGGGRAPEGPAGSVLPWRPRFDRGRDEFDPSARPVLSLTSDPEAIGGNVGGAPVVTPEPGSRILFSASAVLVAYALRAKQRVRPNSTNSREPRG